MEPWCGYSLALSLTWGLFSIFCYRLRPVVLSPLPAASSEHSQDSVCCRHNDADDHLLLRKGAGMFLHLQNKRWELPLSVVFLLIFSHVSGKRRRVILIMFSVCIQTLYEILRAPFGAAWLLNGSAFLEKKQKPAYFLFGFLSGFLSPTMTWWI